MLINPPYLVELVFDLDMQIVESFTTRPAGKSNTLVYGHLLHWPWTFQDIVAIEIILCSLTSLQRNVILLVIP